MTSFSKKLEEIIRVNHAGEMGAKVIYDGQMLALKIKKDEETFHLVKHMKDQEDAHFNYFNSAIKTQKFRPTLMQPIWTVGGFALGFFTALAGKKSAMTCTTAVEEVIDQHYREQLELLKKEEAFLDEKQQEEINKLKEKIEKFRLEELEHRDTAYQNKAAELAYFKPLSAFIKSATKLAIAVSKKI
jgi:3-demethoxyubiquinol 3-hydroxylase